jgi:hypothetical protein
MAYFGTAISATSSGDESHIVFTDGNGEAWGVKYGAGTAKELDNNVHGAVVNMTTGVLTVDGTGPVSLNQVTMP